MNKMKFFSKLIICSSVLIISSISSKAYANGVSSTDIENTYAKDAITKLVEQGVINENVDGKVNPTSKIARQDFAIIMAKALNLDTKIANSTATFSDVPANDYAAKYVEAARQSGLIAGAEGGKFIPPSISRQDLANTWVIKTK